MDCFELLTYSFALLIAQFIPGPDFALVTRSSLVYGVRYGVYCAFGIGAALLFHTIVIACGGEYILRQNILLTRAILLVSAIWILYLAWKAWPSNRDGSGKDISESEPDIPSRKSLFAKAVTTNLLNPKCFLFIGALSAPLLKPGHHPFTPFMVVIIPVGQAIIFWALWSYLLRFGHIERILTRNKVFLDKFFSVLFTFFAVMIIYSVFFWTP